MRKLSVFNLVTLDGFFSGQGGDISWHRVDPEVQEFAEKNSTAANTLLFGRVTYELLAGYWTSAQALKVDPDMNSSPKIVVEMKNDTIQPKS